MDFLLTQLINYLTTTVGGFIYIAKKMYATHLAAMDKLCRVCGAIRSERNCKYYKVVDLRILIKYLRQKVENFHLFFISARNFLSRIIV